MTEKREGKPVTETRVSQTKIIELREGYNPAPVRDVVKPQITPPPPAKKEKK